MAPAATSMKHPILPSPPWSKQVSSSYTIHDGQLSCVCERDTTVCVCVCVCARACQIKTVAVDICLLGLCPIVLCVVLWVARSVARCVTIVLRVAMWSPSSYDPIPTLITGSREPLGQSSLCVLLVDVLCGCVLRVPLKKMTRSQLSTASLIFRLWNLMRKTSVLYHWEMCRVKINCTAMYRTWQQEWLRSAALLHCGFESCSWHTLLLVSPHLSSPSPLYAI